MGTSTAKEGGEHEAEDCAKPLLLDAQSAFDLDDEVIRQAHVVEGLVQRFDIALGLALLVLLACFLAARVVWDMVSSFMACVSNRRCEGNHAPVGARMANVSMKLTSSVCKYLRNNNFQGTVHGNLHKS